jgi:hypothetical protein
MPAAIEPSPNRTEKRINLVLPASAYAEVYGLSKSTKRSLTDLVRLGLGLVKIAIEEVAKGNKLIVASADGQAIKELVIPGL